MAYTLTTIDAVPETVNSTLARELVEFFTLNPETNAVRTSAKRIGSKTRAFLLTNGIAARNVNGAVYAQRVTS